MDERFDSLHLRIEQFETRTTATLDEFREDLGIVSSRFELLERRMAAQDTRTGRLEDGLFGVSVRLDGLADEMRQRFRQVNERLAGAA